MFKFKILGYQFGKSEPEVSIRNVFDQNLKVLLDQKLKLADEISEWEDLVIRQIRAYANKQKSLLEKEYEKRVQYIHKTGQDFVDTLHVYEDNNDTKEIGQLINQCHALKFELTALENSKKNVQFIQVITQEEEPEDIQQNEFDMYTDENDKFEHLEKEDGNETEIYKGINTGPSSKTTLTNAKQTNSKDLSTINSGYNGLIGIDNSQKIYATNGGNMPEKCPVCYMIFPRNMANRDRTQHINEHYADS